jgi:hypothetical protein
MIHIYGDSHCTFLFDGLAGCDVNWLGPVTMHRVGRDRAWFLEGRNFSVTDWVLLVFGEIDARCHIGRIAEDTGNSRDNVVSDLVGRYLASIKRRRDHNAIVMSVPPPADGPGIINSDFPVYGSWVDRIEITKLLNDELIQSAKRADIKVLVVPEEYADASGGLDIRLSDQSVHINTRFAWPILKRLEKITGHQFPELGAARNSR